MKHRLSRRMHLWSAVILLSLTGCDSEERDAELTRLPATPTEAAERVTDVFAEAEPAVQETANVAAQAVRSGEFEKAVVALQTLKERPNATLEQGLAVHGTMVALEAELVNAAASGDENAKRAYELLRKIKRD